MTVVLQIDGLWKEYRLGVIGHGYLFRDVQSWWARIQGKEDPNRPLISGADEANALVWALKDLSLVVNQGEVLGIIGRNGAGKSTLLKIISRVTGPTRGEIKVKGRISSLLEVGVGFHPELTGRENIFLNGTILGMTKEEIRRKFDVIVDYSGVEKFIDTPIKRYSSGMYLRLAFAVAAHLESEILIVDEVLAVGDAEFQQKCLAKIREITAAGRTVLFVSHNLETITAVCKRAILLDEGRLAFDGEAPKAAAAYSTTYSRGKVINGHVSLANQPRLVKKSLSREIRLHNCILRNENGERVDHFVAGRYAGIALEFEMEHTFNDIIFEIIIENHNEQRISYLSNDILAKRFNDLSLRGEVQCVIPRLSLVPGKYSLSFMCRVGAQLVDCIYYAVIFDVVEDESLSSELPNREKCGDFLLDSDWHLEPAPKHIPEITKN